MFTAMKKLNTNESPIRRDWHKSDIKAALEKAGWTLRRLSMHAGYKNPASLQRALRKPWPKAERLIADALGLEPWDIWPSRYTGEKPNRPMGRPKKNIVMTVNKTSIGRNAKSPKSSE
jgi:Ner family transcriptional regulator